jgi:hypothetical protein
MYCRATNEILTFFIKQVHFLSERLSESFRKHQMLAQKHHSLLQQQDIFTMPQFSTTRLFTLKNDHHVNITRLPYRKRHSLLQERDIFAMPHVLRTASSSQGNALPLIVSPQGSTLSLETWTEGASQGETQW